MYAFPCGFGVAVFSDGAAPFCGLLLTGADGCFFMDSRFLRFDRLDRFDEMCVFIGKTPDKRQKHKVVPCAFFQV